MAVRELGVELGSDPSWQWPGQPDEHQSDVAERHLAVQAVVRVRGVDDALKNPGSSFAGRRQLFVVQLHLLEQDGDHCGDAQVENRVHVGRERSERIRALRERALPGLRALQQSIENDRAHQGLPVREVPVERPDADAGPLGDLVQRRVGPALDEHVAGHIEQLLAVAPRVGPGGAIGVGALFRAHTQSLAAIRRISLRLGLRLPMWRGTVTEEIYPFKEACMSTRAPNPTADVSLASERSRDRRWLALVVIAVAQLMVALDATIVNIALPSAQQALGFDDGDRQWVVTAYTLTFAGLLLLGGRVADHLGGRRAFLIGLLGFAAASAVAGAATGFGTLVAGRTLQGAFAALLAPTALSMVVVTFTELRERAKAFGVYGAVASSGGALGLLLGGGLTQYLDWRWCLYVNVAIAVGAMIAGLSVLPDPPVRVRARAAIDVVSGVTITAGLAAVVFACSQAVPHGWTSARVVVPLVVGIVAIGLFLLRQARIPSPLLPLRVLADRSRAGAYVALAAAVVGSYGMFLMLTYYFQVILDWSPLHAGLAFLPLAGAVSASAYGLASRLLPRVAARTLIVPGLLVAAAGLALLTRLDASSGYLTLLLPAELFLGAGMGCVFTPALSIATTGVERPDVGVAAATASTSMQIGGSIGTAVLNTLAITATTAYLSAHTGSARSAREALVHGYAASTGWAAVLLVVVAVVVRLLFRPVTTERKTP